jgi:light-independent protochlorophyllide reductase B subunit
MIQLIDRVSQPHEPSDSASVNILGFCIGQYSWKHDLREIRRLMNLAGIQVNAVLSARCTLDDIRQLPAAALNVVINPEYGLEIAGFLGKRFGTPFITPPHMPIGFDATRQLMDDVLAHFNLAAPAALIQEEAYYRREAVLALSHASRTEYIRGLPVAVFGEWDFAVGLARFLKDYLGCDPVILGIQGHETEDQRASETIDGSLFPSTEIMLNPDADQVMATIDEKKPVILFGSSFEEFILTNITYSPKYFIQTTTPGLNCANLIYRPTIGFAGALTFIESILDQPLTARYPYSMEEISP